MPNNSSIQDMASVTDHSVIKQVRTIQKLNYVVRYSDPTILDIPIMET